MKRLKRSVLSALTVTLLASFAPAASAQPTGEEVRIIREKVASLEGRIDAVGRQIKENPRDAQLRAARGLLYVDLYRALYADRYSHFYRDRPPELAAAALAASAIADLNRAIEVAPSAELYDRRGEMHEVRWAETAEAMKHGAWRELVSPRADAWEVLARPSPEKLELATLGRYVNDPDFASSARDYARALRLSKDARLSESVHFKFGRLHLSRAMGLPLALPPSVKKAIDGPNPYGYSIWSDLDRALEHLSRSDAACGREPGPSQPPWFCAQVITLSSAYFEKAGLALRYGRYRMALDALNAAERYFDPWRGDFLYSYCTLYTARSRLHVKMGNFDAAIRDASRINNDPRRAGVNPRWPGIVCGRAYEARGDAHLGKGEWQAAIADYTAGLDDSSSNTSASAYRNRAVAYSRLGEVEKAIEDLKQYFHRTYGNNKAEDYLMRARLYRKAGREDLAAADEKTAREMIKAARSRAEEVIVLGEIKTPPGVAFDRLKAEVMFADASDPKRHLWTTVDDKGRFFVSYEKGRSFVIHVYHEGVKNGRAMRFYGRTPKLTAGRKVGPLTITLARVVPPG